MNCIIVDDEPLSRKGLSNFINDVPFLQLSATCSNALQLMDELGANPCDLLLLDIQMPKMTGIEFLKNVHSKPLTIITTAYPDYALVSYELDVVDYLVKPIPFERFVKAVDKAKELFCLSSLSKAKTAPNFFFISCDQCYEKVFFDEILFVEALTSYVVIQTESRRLISYLTFKCIEDYLPKSKFAKVNKSNLISLAKVDSFTSHEVRIGPHVFDIGRTQKEEVIQAIIEESKLLRRV